MVPSIYDSAAAVLLAVLIVVRDRVERDYFMRADGNFFLSGVLDQPRR